jgi:hypothetical protein
MLALATLAVLDGKPLAQSIKVEASDDEIARTIDRILSDPDYQLGSAFPFTREEMKAEIAYEESLDWEELLSDEMEDLDEEEEDLLIQQECISWPQVIVMAEKTITGTGKMFYHNLCAEEACAFLAFSTFILQYSEENPPDRNVSIDQALAQLAKRILEEDRYQPGPEFPFTKQEMSIATRHARVSNIKRGCEKFFKAMGYPPDMLKNLLCEPVDKDKDALLTSNQSL